MYGDQVQHCNGCNCWKPENEDRNESEKGECTNSKSEYNGKERVWFDTCVKWETVVVQGLKT